MMKFLMLSPTPIFPATYGNRVRIKRVIEALRARGHKVDFLYYPAEHDWRHDIPEGAISEIAKQVDHFFVAPVSRPLHAPPKSDDHTIDEWWDPALGDYLRWLFLIGKYQVFYVNYTWLSKALNFAPNGVRKILDTHDKFADRRHVLRSLKIRPEFFHTTIAEEAIGHSRADLVLAIKKSEEIQFRAHTASRVETLIHCDEAYFLPTKRVDKDIVRFGIFAAKNNINKSNIEKFLKICRNAIYRSLAPLSIDIYGSVCESLENDFSQMPWVRLFGYVDHQVLFYKNVDVVVIPLESSTGLKIKAAEALSYGKPLLAHKHGFDGLFFTHEAQRCPSLELLCEKMIQLAFSPELLRELSLATRLAHRENLKIFETSIDRICLGHLPDLEYDNVAIFKLTKDDSGAIVDRIIDVARYANYKRKYNIFIRIIGDVPSPRLTSELVGRVHFLRTDDEVTYVFRKLSGSASIISDIESARDVLKAVDIGVTSVIAVSKGCDSIDVKQLSSINQGNLAAIFCHRVLPSVGSVGASGIRSPYILGSFRFWKHLDKGDFFKVENAAGTEYDFEDAFRRGDLNSDFGWGGLWSLL